MIDKQTTLTELKNYANQLKNDVTNNDYLLSDNDVNDVIYKFNSIGYDFTQQLGNDNFFNVKFVRDCILNYLDGVFYRFDETDKNIVILQYLNTFRKYKNIYQLDVDTFNDIEKRFNFLSDKKSSDFVTMEYIDYFWRAIDKEDLYHSIKSAVKELEGRL